MHTTRDPVNRSMALPFDSVEPVPDVIEAFEHDVAWLRRQAFIEHGIEGEPRQTPTGGELVLRKGQVSTADESDSAEDTADAARGTASKGAVGEDEAARARGKRGNPKASKSKTGKSKTPKNPTHEDSRGHGIVLTWHRLGADGTIPWTLRTIDADGNTAEPLAEGAFPKDRLLFPGMSALSTLAEKPPVRTIAPKGKVAAAVFGGTMALVVFGLLRLVGISIPAAAWRGEADFPSLAHILQTVQQVTASLDLGDLPTILAGTVVNMPALGLGILAATSFLLSQQTLPQIGIGDDLVSGRALAMYTVTILCTVGSILLTPFPWNLATGALALFLLHAVLLISTIPWQLDRWITFARHLRIDPWADRPAIAADEHDGQRPTLGQGAEVLEHRAEKLRTRMWKKRDKAFTRRFQRTYLESRTIRITLGIEARASRRGRMANMRWIIARVRFDDLQFRLRHVVLRALPFATALAVVVLALAPTPWIAPTCLTEAGDSTTVYVLPTSTTPAYLDDATRTFTHTTWDGAELTVGACVP